MNAIKNKLTQMATSGICGLLTIALLVTLPMQSGHAEEAKIVLPAANPVLSAMRPAGVTRGTSIEVIVQGTNLASVSAVRVDGKGVSAEIVPPPEGKTVSTRSVTVKLTASPEATIGLHELRLVTPGGTSNVVRFGVGLLPELTEQEPNETADVAMPLVELPVVVNGTVSRTDDRDCFRFSAKAGQQIVLDLCGHRMRPYVSRQRPGWFEGFLTVREATELGVAADAARPLQKIAAGKSYTYKRAVSLLTSRRTSAQKANAEKAAADKVVATKDAVLKTATAQLNAAQASAANVAKAAAAKAVTTAQASYDKAAAELQAAQKIAAQKASAAKSSAAASASAKTAADKANAQRATVAKAAADKGAASKATTTRAASIKAAVALLGFTADKAAAEKIVVAKTAAAEAASEAVATAEAATAEVLAASKKANAEKAAAEKVLSQKTLIANVAAQKVAVATAAAKRDEEGKVVADKAVAALAATIKSVNDKAKASLAASLKANLDKVASAKVTVAKTTAVNTAKAKLGAAKLAAEKAKSTPTAGLSAKIAAKTAAEKAKAAVLKIATSKAATAKSANQRVADASAALKAASTELASANAAANAKLAVVKKIFEVPSRDLVYSSGLDGREDPLLVFTAPKDGQYVVEVRDDLYRGRAEFNYRLVIGELPYVTGAFPAGGQRGTTAAVKLVGYNLGSTTNHSVPIAADAVGEQRTERSSNALGSSNDFRIEVGSDLEIVEAEPNNVIGQATPTKVPATLNGVIESEGDLDCYKFAATKGQRLIFETVSRAFGSPLDARLDLYDINGRRLKYIDDVNTKPDALIDYTFTADGEYVIRVGDTTGFGSPRHVYRLEVHAPRPDFELTVSPDNPRVAAGGTVALKVLVQRREGFKGEIQLTVPQPPPGAVVSPAIFSGSLTEQTVTVTVPAGAAASVTPFSVVGKAKVDDQEIVRQATSAEQVRYVNAWRYVPVSDLTLSVTQKLPFTIAWGQAETKVLAGKTIKVPIKIQRVPGFTAPVRLVLQGLPSKVAAPPIVIEENGNEAIVEIRAASTAPANITNVVVSGSSVIAGRTYSQSSPALRLNVEVPPKKVATPKKK